MSEADFTVKKAACKNGIPGTAGKLASFGPDAGKEKEPDLKKPLKKVRLFNPIPITQHLIRPHQWNFVQTFFQVIRLADEETPKNGF
jgi:hypothetical protein